LVPEGYVRFLNEDEERQYLAQSPPSNTLLPRDQDTTILSSSGDETPRPPISHTKQQWIQLTEDTTNQGGGGGEWVDGDDDAAKEDRNVDEIITERVMHT
jgi:beta-lactam-binding protein with PASTA domain